MERTSSLMQLLRNVSEDWAFKSFGFVSGKTEHGHGIGDGFLLDTGSIVCIHGYYEET